MKSPVDIAKHYFEFSNKGDFEGIRALLTDSTTYSSVNTGLYVGRDSIMEMQRKFHEQFKSLSWKIVSIEEVKPGIVLFNFEFAGEKLNGELVKTSGLEYIIVHDELIQHVEVRNQTSR